MILKKGEGDKRQYNQNTVTTSVGECWSYATTFHVKWIPLHDFASHDQTPFQQKKKKGKKMALWGTSKSFSFVPGSLDSTTPNIPTCSK